MPKGTTELRARPAESEKAFNVTSSAKRLLGAGPDSSKSSATVQERDVTVQWPKIHAQLTVTAADMVTISHRHNAARTPGP